MPSASQLSDAQCAAFHRDGYLFIEHFLDAENDFDSFFYTWSELTLSFDGRITTGFALQRTHAYESERELQRGLLLGVGGDGWGTVIYVFDPDTTDPTCVMSAYAEF